MPPEIPKHKFFTLNLVLRLAMFVSMFAVIFTFALASVFGYQIDLSNASLNPASMIQISTVPTGSSAAINDQALPFFSNGRTSVASGNYKVDVSRGGFYDWQTVIPIKARTICWVNARLVPKVKRVATVKTYQNLLSSYASPDRRWLLNYLAPNLYELVDLRGDKPSYQTLNLATMMSASSRLQQDFRFYDWNLANDTIFFRDIISNKMYLLGLHNRSHAIDLSNDYPGVVFDQVKVGGDGGKTIYALSGRDLYRISLDRPRLPIKIAGDVVDYRIINRDQVVFTQLAPSEANFKLSVLVYDFTKNHSVEFEQLKSNDPVLLEAFESRHDGHKYIVLYDQHRLRVWRSDATTINSLGGLSLVDYGSRPTDGADSRALQRFKLANPSFSDYFSIYLEKSPSGVSIGGDGRLIMVDEGKLVLSSEDATTLATNMTAIKGARSGEPISTSSLAVNQIFVLDTNYKNTYSLKLSLDSGSLALAEKKGSPNWLSDNVLWENLFGTVRIKDFSGQNQHKLIPASGQYDIQLSANEKYVYFYQTIGGLPVLRRLQMTD